MLPSQLPQLPQQPQQPHRLSWRQAWGHQKLVLLLLLLLVGQLLRPAAARCLAHAPQSLRVRCLPLAPAHAEAAAGGPGAVCRCCAGCRKSLAVQAWPPAPAAPAAALPPRQRAGRALAAGCRQESRAQRANCPREEAARLRCCRRRCRWAASLAGRDPAAAAAPAAASRLAQSLQKQWTPQEWVLSDP